MLVVRFIGPVRMARACTAPANSFPQTMPMAGCRALSIRLEGSRGGLPQFFHLIVGEHGINVGNYKLRVPCGGWSMWFSRALQWLDQLGEAKFAAIVIFASLISSASIALALLR